MIQLPKKLILVAGFFLAAHALLGAEETAPAPAPAASPAAAETPDPEPAMSPEEAMRIQGSAKQAVEEEIKVFGSFEIEHPDTEELLKLSLTEVKQEVRPQPDGMFIVPADFKDEQGNPYGVDLYLESFDNKETYEVVDALLVTANGQPVEEEGETLPE